jgi:hypothetical protein
VVAAAAAQLRINPAAKQSPEARRAEQWDPQTALHVLNSVVPAVTAAAVALSAPAMWPALAKLLCKPDCDAHVDFVQYHSSSRDP